MSVTAPLAPHAAGERQSFGYHGSSARSSSSIDSTPSLMHDSDSPQTSSDGLSPHSHHSGYQHDPSAVNAASHAASTKSASTTAATSPFDPASAASPLSWAGSDKAGPTATSGATSWELPFSSMEGLEGMGASWDAAFAGAPITSPNASQSSAVVSPFANSPPSSQSMSMPSREEIQREIQMAMSRFSHGGDATGSAGGWAAGQANGWQPMQQQQPQQVPAQQQQGHAQGGAREGQDDDMFTTMIQEDSFDAPSETASDVHSVTSPSRPLASAMTAMHIPSESLTASSSRPKAASSTVPTSAAPSALSSRRNSMEHSESSSGPGRPRKSSSAANGAAGIVPRGKDDTELGFSSESCVRPAVSDLRNLQIHVHGIAATGHKSRVETQIRTRIELVRPAASGSGFERIGSFERVKLPPLTATKRKSRKFQVPEVEPHKVLFLDAAVVNATPPHQRVYVCKGCREREKKRQNRKKGQKVAEMVETPLSADEMRNVGIDPDEPDADAKARQRIDEEDKQRVVLFNCGDYIDFTDGNALLPTRITCYCRHHKESTGFCIIYTMRDWRGSVVATGSTPPIMITDDHKSVQANQNAHAQRANLASRNVSVSAPAPAEEPAPAPAPALESKATRGPAAAAANGSAKSRKRNDRSKPYGDVAEHRAQRRATNASNGSAPPQTPLATTGYHTPATGASPPAQGGFSRAELWDAFGSAQMSRAPSTAQQPQVQSQAPAPATVPPPPHQAPAPQHQQMPPQQQQQQQHQQQPPAAWPAAAMGSLSPTTLNTHPQSMPGFDYDAFLRATAAGDTAAATAMLMNSQPSSTPLASMPPAPPPPLPTSNELRPPPAAPEVPSVPQPTITKLIPGEGPTSGGIEVTVLGENFVDGLVAVFGDVPAAHTRVWASNTLVCVLPPSPSPGPVVVDLKGYPQPPASSDQGHRPLQLFNYIDTTDRALMELALQVVGLQMTGQMQSARDVAMRVVGSGAQHGGARGPGAPGGSSTLALAPAARDAVTGLFAGGTGARGEANSFQQSVLQFLGLLDVDLDDSALPEGCTPRKDAVRLANRQGHTLLHLSVMLGFHRLALALLERGCPPNARDHNGFTALHFAALGGRVTIARMLLAHGARDDLTTHDGKLPVQIAYEKDQVDVERLLVDSISSAAAVIVRARAREGRSMRLAASPSSVADSLDDSSGEQGIDDGNISTGLDASDVSDESDVSTDSLSSGEELSDSLPEAPAAETDDVTPKPSSPRDEKSEKEIEAAANVPASEKTKLTLENALGLRSLAHKLQLANGFGFAMASLPDRLHGVNLQMPAVPVFHLAMPQAPNFIASWSRSSSSEGGSDAESDGAAKAKKNKGKAKEQRSKASSDEQSQVLSAWRNIIEESALWINPLYSPPPPTYESATAAADGSGSSEHRRKPSTAAYDEDGAMTSRFPAIAEPSQSSPYKRDRSRRSSASGSRPSSARSYGVEGDASSHASSSRRTLDDIDGGDVASSRRSRRSASTSSPALEGAAASSAATAAARKPRRGLREDAMLMYFWLPALVVVIAVILFANPSSVLSFADLASYMPTA